MKTSFSLILGASLLSSCASTPAQGPNNFQIFTTPPDAAVTTTLETQQSEQARKSDESLSREVYGCLATPCSFTVPPRSVFVVRVEKPGFKTAHVIVQSATLPPQNSSDAVTNATSISLTEYIDKSKNIAAIEHNDQGNERASSDIFKTLATATLLGSVGAIALSGKTSRIYPNPVYLELIPIDTSLSN